MSLGRMGTSLTTEGMRGMLLTANIHPASASSMQDTANKVGEKISSVNRRSMTDIRKSLKEKNSECGLPVNSSIRAEGDARYNNSTFSALGKTPFQAGTQVTYTMCENVTSEKKIISVFCGNKLCKKGEYMRGKGEQVTCPGHTGCTANLTQQTNIGNEKQWAAECIEELNKDEDPLTISHLTTDGDSAASQGASIKQGKNIENLKDLRHFFESQRKETSKAPFGERMFPGRTKADRESAKKRFAQDLKTRCRSEYEKAHKYFGGDMQKLTNALSYAVDAIISCYRELCKAVGAPVVKGSKVAHLLKQQQNRQNYFRQRERSIFHSSHIERIEREKVPENRK
ncbi:uncharacterized protein LOC134266309 [Saccostrea cucullata]|uniref:uncharacterized protein LOC134266309 n=1 Tax=Saccostrea cuccullata TaxID=36930 RepID=UPI002ED385EA